LERSIVDVKHGVMITESKNLEFTGVLSVIERQLYRRPTVDLNNFFRSYSNTMRSGFKLLPQDYALPRRGAVNSDPEVQTDVTTKVELVSRLGQGPSRFFKSKAAVGSNDDEEETPAKIGFFRSLGQASIQRSIEAIGLRRTERAVPKSQDGMNVVLERLRRGGLVAVLEGMRRDSDEALTAAT